MDLFSLMGMESPTPAEEKKVTPKKEEKKSTPKATPKKEEKKYKLPLKVVSGLFSTEIEGEGEKTLSEVKAGLIERGFVSLKTAAFAIGSDESTVIVGLPTKATDASVRLIKAASDSYVVEAGEFKYEYDGETDGAKVASVLEGFLSCNPEYQGCKLVYNMSYGTFVPTGEKLEEIEPESMYEIIFNGECVQVKGSEVAEFIGIPQDADKVKIMPIDGKYLIAIEVKDEIAKKGGSSTSTSAAPKKEEVQKFKLPATVTFSHTADKQITSEMFGGKEEITNKELQEWLFNMYEEYTADKTEFLYFKKDNIIEARIKSSKRG